jgi:hypothetical protein
MVTVLQAVVVAVCARLMADDCKAWSTWVVDRLMRRAVAKVPECYRDRLREEWLAHLQNTPGDIAKITEAIGFNWAARGLHLAEQQRLLRIAECENALRRIDYRMVEKHFSSLPRWFRDLALDVYRARAKQRLEAGQLTPTGDRGAG